MSLSAEKNILIFILKSSLKTGHGFNFPASQKKTFSVGQCVFVQAQKKQPFVILPSWYVVFRPSVGWEDCGGSCTLCGSMWADYMLGSSCWSGRRMPLDKLHRTSTSLEEPIMQRKRKRSCPNSHLPALHHHFYSCALTQFTGLFFFFFF